MQTSGFFNSAVAADGSYDRQYVAEQFAEYFASFVGNGVFQNYSGALMVTESESPAMSVTVQPGQGWINGYWYKNSTELPLSVAVSDGVLGRIDLVVLQLGFSERTIQCVVKTGTPSANPVAPSLQRDSDYYELCLAQINIPSGTINIQNSAIVDTRSDNDVCGWVQAAVQSIDTTYFGNQLNQFITRYIQKADEEYLDYQQAIENEYDNFEQTFRALLDRLRELVNDDDALGRLVTELSAKENRYTSTAKVIYMTDWVNNEYSFEEDYPATNYDITVDLDWDRMNDERESAWVAARVVGSNSANKLVARNSAPTADIPVVITVTPRDIV